MNVLQAGFPVDVVFRLAVQSINGIDNRRVAGGISREHVRPANPEFYVLLEQLGRIQNSGDLGVRVSPKGDTLTLVFRRSHSAAVRQAVRNVTNILGLDPEAKEFHDRLWRGAVEQQGDRDGHPVDLRGPARHRVDHHRARDARDGAPGVGRRRRATSVRTERSRPSSRSRVRAERPGDAFVAIPYHGHWFSIDDRDPASKNLFSFILLLFTFVETGSKDIVPVLSIPTTR